MEQSKPNSLAQALAARKPAAEHPDADVLNAFVEDSLLAREREAVMAHLAGCAECREVVSLSAMNRAPARELELVAATAPMMASVAQQADRVAPAKRRAWVPWAAAAAACLAIVSFVVVRSGQKGPVQNAAIPSQTAPAAEPSKTVAVNAPPPAPVPGAAMERARRDAQVANKNLAQGDLVNEHRESKDEKKATAAARSEMGQAVSRQAELSQGLVAGSKPPMTQDVATQDALSATNQAVQLEQQQAVTRKTENAVALEQKPVQDARAQSNAATGGARAMAPSFGAMAKSAPAGFGGRAQWRISSDGHVERTLGFGSWQTVLTSEPNRMHVVSVVGGTVWAGGENDVVYRSEDAGVTWQRVTLAEKNGTAHAIAHIRFESATVGTIEAADGTIWATADGGATWK